MISLSPSVWFQPYLLTPLVLRSRQLNTHLCTRKSFYVPKRIWPFFGSEIFVYFFVLKYWDGMIQTYATKRRKKQTFQRKEIVREQANGRRLTEIIIPAAQSDFIFCVWFRPFSYMWGRTAAFINMLWNSRLSETPATVGHSTETDQHQEPGGENFCLLSFCLAN